MAAIYTVFTSPNHAPIPNHLPTLIVTPHGQPSNVLYSYLHTNFNQENYLLTPSPQGDLCVAKLFPPSRHGAGKSAASDPGHGPSSASGRAVRCEASRNLKWNISNTGVMSPIYKLTLPSPDSPELPLFQVSKPNPNAAYWSMFYFAYAGHNIPPKRIEFGKIQKNPPGPGGGGTRITITGKTPEEKAVWQTLGEGNEDCVEWVVLCAALNLLDDEILKAAEKAGVSGGGGGPPPPRPSPGPAPPSMRGAPPQGQPPHQQHPQHLQQRPGPPQQYPPGQGGPPPQHYGRGAPPPQGQGQRPYPPPQGQHPQQYASDGRPYPPPQPGQQQYQHPPPPRSGSVPPAAQGARRV